MEQWELEEKRREFIHDFYYGKLNFCGCGSPSDTLYVVRNVLNLIADKNKYDYDNYWNEFKSTLNLKDELILGSGSNFYINEDVFQIVLNILNNSGVLEHGSSIGGSWLSKYGEELLSHLNSLSDEDLEWILS